MLNRLATVLATRLGLAGALTIVFSAALSAILYVEISIDRIRHVERQFDERLFHSGFEALHHIRDIHGMLDAKAPGRPLSTAFRDGFGAELEKLENQAASLIGRPRGSAEIDESTEAIAGRLRELLESGRRILHAEPGEVDRTIWAFEADADAVRSDLVTFLYEVRRVENTVVATQSEGILVFRNVIIAVLGAMALTGALALLLLRREILSGLARERAEERVHFLAYFDPLTGLPNRVRLKERASLALSEAEAASLLLIDLDEFKQINDTYGHEAGDRVLVHAAGIFADEADAVGGFAARLSGDEFAVLVPTEGAQALAALCERILQRLSVPFTQGPDTFTIGASLGVAARTQVSASMTPSYECMARVADFALYTSKQKGRGCHTFYDTEVEQQFMLRRAMLAELPGAVSEGALEVFLQPQFSVRDRRICSFEALVRWRRNETLVPPQAFIQMAEESGLITTIDFFVLGEATRIVGAWNRANCTRYGVSVNFSGSVFCSDHIIAAVSRALEASGLDPALLTVEVTESVEIHDWDNMQRLLMKLRDLGCRISIDDFGTGYSSLAYVRAMSADELKIDRSLLQEIEEEDTARFVLDAIVDLGSKFAMDIVAEGVETPEQARIVESLGIDLIQGYLIGAPVPAAHALAAAADYHAGAAASSTAPAVRLVSPEGPAERPRPSGSEAHRPASERVSRVHQAGGG